MVVDVGGGTGSPAMILAGNFAHLRIVVQDREAVVKQGIEVVLILFKFLISLLPSAHGQFWEKKNPEALKSGRVSFQGTCSTLYP